jgi:hypothetical protein
MTGTKNLASKEVAPNLGDVGTEERRENQAHTGISDLV